MAKQSRKPSKKIAQTKNIVSPSTPSSGAPFPIDELPNEVLELVLLFSLPDALTNPAAGSHIAYYTYLDRCDSIDYPRLLSRVCRRWRAIVEGCPALWSYICVDVGAFETNLYNADHYETVLAKSGDHPLSLSCLVGTGKTKDLRTLLNGPVFAAHLQRLRKLSVQTYFIARERSTPEAEEAELMLSLFPTADTPMLESIRIDCSKASKSMARYLRKLSRTNSTGLPADLHIVRYAPRLKEFVLEGLDVDTILPEVAEAASSYFSLQRLGLAGLRWSNMTHLRLPDIGRRVTDLLRALAHATRLVELRCAVFENQEDWRAREGGTEHAELSLPLVFLELLALHLVLISFEARAFDIDPERRSGIDRFLSAIVAPSLTSLEITRGGEGTSERDGEDRDWREYDGRIVGDGGERKVYPYLQAFLHRSGSTIDSFALANLALHHSELFSILQLVPSTHTLHLKDATKRMGFGFWCALRRHEHDGRPAFVPCLHRLVVMHDLGEATPSTFTAEDVADMVNKRWRAGLGDGARIEVAHRPEARRRSEGFNGEHPNLALMQRDQTVGLRRTQARDDLELVYTEVGSRWTERDRCFVILRDEEYMRGERRGVL
ncbi:hypothetical protein GGG16DRAFT_101666 [Schizophyllum commune]